MRLIRTNARTSSSTAERPSGEIARVRPRDLVQNWARRRRVRRGFALRTSSPRALAPAKKTLEMRVPTSSATELRLDAAAIPWRETHATWFERALRPSWSIAAIEHVTFSDLMPTPTVVVQRAGELSPSRAGALAGAIGAALATGALGAGAASEPVRAALLRLGVVLSAHRVEGFPGAALAVAFVILLGALLGLCFATVARRLRKLAPLAVVSVVLSVAAGLLARAVVCVRVAPALASALPMHATLLAAAVFGLALALELPIRVRVTEPVQPGVGTHASSHTASR
jgi:hypothetical protein